MNTVAQDYLPILVFLMLAIGLSIFIVVLPYIFAKFKPNKAKLSAYECGFDPFSTPRQQFNIKFYLTAMLFIIFDLEIAFLVPWSLVLKKIGSFGFYSMMVFLFVLIIGFVYEWSKGALDW